MISDVVEDTTNTKPHLRSDEFNPACVETEIIWENLVHTRTHKFLVPYGSMISTLENEWVLAFHGEGFQLPVPYQYREMIENIITCLCFLIINQEWQELRAQTWAAFTQKNLSHKIENLQWKTVGFLHSYLISNVPSFMSIQQVSLGLTHWGQDEMAAMLQVTFSNALLWIKTFDFQIKLHWNMFFVSNRQLVTIGLGNDLAPNRPHAITSTNDDPVHWCIYESLGLNKSTKWP